MTAVTAFNEMMGQFLVELHKTFPEEKGIKKFMTSFDLLKSTNPRKCVEAYMGGVGAYAEKITRKDDTFFTEDIKGIEFLQDLNIEEHWNVNMSDATKGAVWQYLQTLYMLGTTITAIPQETLSVIESVAKDCAEKMQNGDGQIDEKALMSMFTSMMKK
jgi:hypothetical protein|tara:strand:+ start:577 stop:1053 length:477 start_codon:yes stop_codon:yes gene_type:complete